MVDQTGQPWPEKALGGVSPVLDVALKDLGKAVWAYAGQTIAPVGQFLQS